MMQRGAFKRIYDWIWFYWYLGGNYQHQKLQPNKEVYSKMTGREVTAYYKKSMKRRKKARELKEYYDFVNKLKLKKKVKD